MSRSSLLISDQGERDVDVSGGARQAALAVSGELPRLPAPGHLLRQTRHGLLYVSRLLYTRLHH